MEIEIIDNQKVFNGIYYNVETKDSLIYVLDRLRQSKTRIVLDYGNIETNESWGEIYDITGRIGITGPKKILILVHNSRSLGGTGILTHRIISIRESKGKTLLYKNSIK